MILVMRMSTHSDNKEAGQGSSEQDLSGDAFIIFITSSAFTGLKVEKSGGLGSLHHWNNLQRNLLDCCWKNDLGELFDFLCVEFCLN